MKRHLLIAAALLITATGAYMAFSQQTTTPAVTPQEADPNTNGGPPYGKICPFCSMMGQSIFATQLVAMPDGGVLVLTAGKLYKYDANLTLVSEAPLQIDAQQIQTQLQGIMSSCPICPKKAPGFTNELTNGTSNGMPEKSKADTKKSTSAPKETY